MLKTSFYAYNKISNKKSPVVCQPQEINFYLKLPKYPNFMVAPILHLWSISNGLFHNF